MSAVSWFVSVETDAGVYRLDPVETEHHARQIAEDVFANQSAKIGSHVITTAIIASKRGVSSDYFDGEWSSRRMVE